MSARVLDVGSSASASTLRHVIAASAVGTIFEWYEFFLFGALASIIASQFFSGVGETAGFIFALLSFAAGFAMRPVGALLFGHIGDSRGRKVAFLTTIGVMGVATVLIGCLPVYSQVGIWSPVTLILLRLIQGVALGGEYGGAATYVAEQAPSSQRGFYTSLMHGAAALGLVLALGIIYFCRSTFGEAVFRDFAWRIPFWFSTVILAVSLWARRSLEEPRSFQALKSAGELSKAPVREALGKWPNLRLILIALFGFMAADGAIWYTAQFYTQFFLERSLHVEPALVNLLFVCVASIGAPLYVLFGWLSDRVGRKPVIVSAIAAALLTYLPLFHVLSRAANPALVAVTQSSPVTIAAFPGDCTLQFDVLGRGHFTSDCDRARRALSRAGISYTTIDVPSNTPVRVHIGATVVDFTSHANDIENRLIQALMNGGYPMKPDRSAMNMPLLLGALLGLLIPAAALFGPIGAALVELFPTRLRYTAMSLPYHIGTGWFGGFMPAVAFMIVAATGNSFSGLYYTLVIAAMSLLVAIRCWPETVGRDLAQPLAKTP